MFQSFLVYGNTYQDRAECIQHLFLNEILFNGDGVRFVHRDPNLGQHLIKNGKYETNLYSQEHAERKLYFSKFDLICKNIFTSLDWPTTWKYLKQTDRNLKRYQNHWNYW